jgi:hypothetical protein
MEKKVNITKKYNHEIMDIQYKLRQLENGKIYELTRAKMDGCLSTNVDQLRNMIEELINKIEYDEDSIEEEIAKAYKKIDL